MMNNDRNIMLDLQDLWNSVMKLEAEAERSRKSIALWESRNRELAAETAKAENDYKNINLLRRFVSDTGQIDSRRRTGTCAKHQRRVTRAIKRARYLALLPYTAEHIRRYG